MTIGSRRVRLECFSLSPTRVVIIFAFLRTTGVLERLTEFCVQSGISIGHVHHHSKGNQAEKEAIDRGSGAGSFGRDPDVILDFTDHEDTSPAKPIFSVSVIIREFEHIGDFVVYWEPPLLIKDTTGLNPHDLKQRQKARRPKKDKEYDQAIMAALYGAEEGGGLSWTRLAYATNIPRSPLTIRLEELEKKGEIIRSPVTKLYSLSVKNAQSWNSTK